MRNTLAVSTVFVVATALAAQEPISPALQAMVDTERAFAQAATQKGIRDSFLEYFAADSIAFSPAPVSATERLRGRPSRAFSEAELRWEPRTGDVAASGELGWLTGPSTFTDHTVANARTQPGNYLSIWRRQADGQWRVFIDQGTQPPETVSFAPGFTRFAFPSRYTGGETGTRATASLQAADRGLNAALGRQGGAAYGDVTSDTSRLHRSGSMPSIGRVAIENWMKEHASAMTATTGAAESALSGDLGYAYGRFEVSAPVAKSGAYVRVWQRDAGGKWLVVADVTQ
jgi:ketosteroid isomerase-like protein